MLHSITGMESTGEMFGQWSGVGEGVIEQEGLDGIMIDQYGRSKVYFGYAK